MKTKSKKGRKKTLPHPALDLFGEVPVTWDEVYLWCEKVPRISRDSWRLSWYLRGWNVPEKIRAAKLSGDFQRLTHDDGFRPVALHYF